MTRLKISDTHVFTEYCTEYRKLREKKIIKEKKPFIHFNYIYDHRTSFFFLNCFAFFVRTCSIFTSGTKHCFGDCYVQRDTRKGS